MLYLKYIEWYVSDQQHYSHHNHKEKKNNNQKIYMENQLLVFSGSGHTTPHISEIHIDTSRLWTSCLHTFLKSWVVNIWLWGSWTQPNPHSTKFLEYQSYSSIYTPTQNFIYFPSLAAGGSNLIYVIRRLLLTKVIIYLLTYILVLFMYLPIQVIFQKYYLVLETRIFAMMICNHLAHICV